MDCGRRNIIAESHGNEVMALARAREKRNSIQKGSGARLLLLEDGTCKPLLIYTS